MATAPPLVRHLDIAVLRDVQLGALEAQPEALLEYLRSVRPATLVLTGEIAKSSVFGGGRLSTATLRVVLRLGELAAEGTRIYLIAEQEPDWLPANRNLLHRNVSVRKTLLLHQGGEKFYFGREHAKSSVLSRVRSWIDGQQTATTVPAQPLSARVQLGHRLATHHNCTTCVLLDNQDAMSELHTEQQQRTRIVAPASWTQTQTSLELRFGEWSHRNEAVESTLLRRIVAAGPTVH